MPYTSFDIKWFIKNSLWLLLFFANPCLAQTSKITQLQAKLNQVQADTARLHLLQQISEAYTSVDPIKKLYYANLFKTLAEKLHNEQAIADAYVQIGISYGVRSKLDSALIFFKLAYNQSAKIKYLLGMGKSLSDMGFVYDHLDNDKEAIKCDFQALAILKKTTNQRGINQLYINIGSIYFDLKKYELAETYFNQCLISYTASKDTAGIGYGLFVMGNCFQALKQDDKALDYFSKSLAIREKLGDVNGIALVKRGMGQAYFHQKQYEQSLNYLNTALKSIQGIQDKYEECAVLLDLSDVYLAINDYNKAIAAATRSMNYCKEIKSNSGVSEAIERLIAAYKKKGDFKKASQYQSEYITMQENILNDKALKDVTLTEFGRIRSENAALTKNNRLIASKNNNYLAQLNQYTNIIVVIGVILASVILLLLIIYRRNLEKQTTNKLLLQQKEEIAAINEELEALNEEINTQMEIVNTQNSELERLNGVKNKFFSIVSHDLRAPLSTLQTLFSIYHRGDIDEDDFEMLLARLEGTLISTAEFLDNLLEWSKNQLEGMIIKPANFNIGDCIAENIRLFESQIGLKRLKVDNQANGPLMVYADRNMITLVIRNLLSNSIKFCRPGDEITFSVKREANQVLIAIHDTGPGISEADSENLFNLEHTISAGTQNEKGNHLGLILCRDMVIQNNGNIQFESKPGEGTTFWVELPVEEFVSVPVL